MTAINIRDFETGTSGAHAGRFAPVDAGRLDPVPTKKRPGHRRFITAGTGASRPLGQHFEPTSSATSPTRRRPLATSSAANADTAAQQVSDEEYLPIALSDWLDSLQTSDVEELSQQDKSAWVRKLNFSFAIAGETTTRSLLTFLGTRKISANSMMFICDAIGRTSSELSGLHPLAVLTQLLTHPVPASRDAAIVGLALLDDKRSMPALENALARERLGLLRESLEALIAQLR